MLKKIFQRFDLNLLEEPVEAASEVSGLLTELYIVEVAQQRIQYDPAQIQTLDYLQKILDWLVLNKSARRTSCPSLYIYGDVGRGKSMLMALFYEACPIKQKRRVHFNIFMQEVHTFIHSWRIQNKSDAISALAEHIRSSVRVLCFDEFHVTDIADAMILGRLFSKLFELDLVVVITSNRHPNELYQGGLQREQFLFFIELLLKTADVVELAADQDYRLNYQAAEQISYFCPLLDETDQDFAKPARKFVKQAFREMTGGVLPHPDSILMLGRELQLAAVHNDILLSSFKELCVQPLGSADYLAIAQRFNIVIIAAIPRLSAEKRNEAKRFVTLIDVLYEHTIKLICSAEVPPQGLYTDGDGAFEFQRTVSRLIEMQSASYCQRAEAMRKQRLLNG